MTLMEVMLAISLVVMMMGSVYAFYSGALSSRDRITTAAEQVSAVRSVMDRMTTELRASLVFAAPRIDTEAAEAEAAAELADNPDIVAGLVESAESRGGQPVDTAEIEQAVIKEIVSRLTTIGMEGSGQDVSFPTAALPGPSAWAESGATDTDRVIQATGDVELIGYRLRAEEDDAGNVVGIVGLERSRKKELVLSADFEDEEENTVWVLVSPHIKHLRMRYWEGGDWIESWQGGDIPAAVEITLGFKPLPEDCEPEDYPYQSFRRIVFIPVATGSGATGTIMRGLGGGSSP